MAEKRKTICMLLSTHYSAFMGGAQYQAKCILDGLIPTNKYNIHYITRRVDPNFTPEGYKIHQISSDKNVSRLSFYFDSIQLYKILKEINPDVIYQRVAGPYTGIAAYYAKKNNCKMIWHVAHTTDVTPHENVASANFILKFLERTFVEYGLRNATYIVAQTEEQSKLLDKYYGRKSDKIVPNFHPTPKGSLDKSDEISVVWIANFKPWKQPDVFVRLAKDLQMLNNVHFVMIGALQGGNTEWREKLKCDMDELNNLIYKGKMTQNDINDLLARAHIFVNTSLHEGFANTFIQAWMRKVPVVSLHVNPDHIFDRFEIGYCSDTYEELLENVKNLILNKEQRVAMGNSSKVYAQQYHSFKNVELLMELLDS